MEACRTYGTAAWAFGSRGILRNNGHRNGRCRFKPDGRYFGRRLPGVGNPSLDFEGWCYLNVLSMDTRPFAGICGARGYCARLPLLERRGIEGEVEALSRRNLRHSDLSCPYPTSPLPLSSPGRRGGKELDESLSLPALPSHPTSKSPGKTCPAGQEFCVIPIKIQ